MVKQKGLNPSDAKRLTTMEVMQLFDGAPKQTWGQLWQKAKAKGIPHPTLKDKISKLSESAVIRIEPNSNDFKDPYLSLLVSVENSFLVNDVITFLGNQNYIPPKRGDEIPMIANSVFSNIPNFSDLLSDEDEALVDSLLGFYGQFQLLSLSISRKWALSQLSSEERETIADTERNIGYLQTYVLDKMIANINPGQLKDQIRAHFKDFLDDSGNRKTKIRFLSLFPFIYLFVAENIDEPKESKAFPEANYGLRTMEKALDIIRAKEEDEYSIIFQMLLIKTSISLWEDIRSTILESGDLVELLKSKWLLKDEDLPKVKQTIDELGHKEVELTLKKFTKLVNSACILHVLGRLGTISSPEGKTIFAPSYKKWNDFMKGMLPEKLGKTDEEEEIQQILFKSVSKTRD